jgi:hypothetical protein
MDGRTYTSLSDNVSVSTIPMSLQVKAEPRNAFLGEGEPTRLANEFVADFASMHFGICDQGRSSPAV